MRLDLCQVETAQIAKEQGSLLDEACQKLSVGKALSRLEQNCVLQVIIGNAISKAKQTLKAHREPVPASVYDTIASLARIRMTPTTDMSTQNAAIGPSKIYSPSFTSFPNLNHIRHKL